MEAVIYKASPFYVRIIIWGLSWACMKILNHLAQLLDWAYDLMLITVCKVAADLCSWLWTHQDLSPTQCAALQPSGYMYPSSPIKLINLLQQSGSSSQTGANSKIMLEKSGLEVWAVQRGDYNTQQANMLMVAIQEMLHQAGVTEHNIQMSL